MGEGIVGFLLDNFGIRELIILSLVFHFGEIVAISQLFSNNRAAKLESRAEDIQIRADHRIDIHQLDNKIDRVVAELRTEISDVGTDFERILKEQAMHINDVLSRSKQI